MPGLRLSRAFGRGALDDETSDPGPTLWGSCLLWGRGHSSRPSVCPARIRYSSFVKLHSSLQESEIKSVDVRLVEDERLPEKHLICLHFDGAEPPRTEAGLSDGQLPRRKSAPCVNGEISEIERIPEYRHCR